MSVWKLELWLTVGKVMCPGEGMYERWREDQV